MGRWAEKEKQQDPAAGELPIVSISGLRAIQIGNSESKGFEPFGDQDGTGKHFCWKLRNSGRRLLIAFYSPKQKLPNI